MTLLFRGILRRAFSIIHSFIFTLFHPSIDLGFNTVGKVRIGDGAIIASGSVVTEDVNPYSIVAGNPAKEIRKRFDDETISQLLEFKWWDKSEEWLRENSKEMSDINRFKKMLL